MAPECDQIEVPLNPVSGKASPSCSRFAPKRTTRPYGEYIMGNVSYQDHRNISMGKGAKSEPKPIASEIEQLTLSGIIEVATMLKNTKTDATFKMRKAKLILLVRNL